MTVTICNLPTWIAEGVQEEIHVMPPPEITVDYSKMPEHLQDALAQAYGLIVAVHIATAGTPEERGNMYCACNDISLT